VTGSTRADLPIMSMNCWSLFPQALRVIVTADFGRAVTVLDGSILKGTETVLQPWKMRLGPLMTANGGHEVESDEAKYSLDQVPIRLEG
jgi:hypothetical protein